MPTHPVAKETIILSCEDTDVLILALSALQDVVQSVYQKTGGLTKMRYVNLTEIGNVTGTVNVLKSSWNPCFHWL